jgi:hypothetical protein
MQRLRIPALLLFGMLGGCKAPGATLTRLLSINDSGQIVGGTGAHGVEIFHFHRNHDISLSMAHQASPVNTPKITK